jgi:sugar phosphate isomerase/epimerase
MAYDRRLFLKAAGFAAIGSFAYPLVSCSNAKKEEGSDESATKEGSTINDFGLQLYSVRDLIGKDPKAMLKQIADLGYKKIESYQGEQGIYWGMTPKDFKAYMSDLGMEIVSTHADTTKDLEKIAAEAAEAGLGYVLQPYIGAQSSVDEWKKRAEDFSKRGEICKKAGIKFGYHNHDYSFKPLDGVIPQEILLDNTDASLVVFELDLCWITAAGVDPNEHMKKYSGRYELCHIKDVVREPKVQSTDLGDGIIDFGTVLKTASENGMKQFIVEQEDYPVDVMTSIGNDANYMKQLVI